MNEILIRYWIHRYVMMRPMRVLRFWEANGFWTEWYCDSRVCRRTVADGELVWSARCYRLRQEGD